MIESVDTVAFGRPASTALAAAITRAKGGAPLAGVTVIVPSNFAGLAARRTVASGLDGAAGGLVNVSFATVLRVAQLLAADVPGVRQPLTNPVLASAVRRALAGASSPFREVAGHRATEVAVAATYAELSRLTPEALALVAADAWGGRVVALHERVRALLGDYADEDAVVQSVLARPQLDVASAVLGHVIWYMPEPISPARTALIARLLELRPASVLVGCTGSADADAPVFEVCRRAGVDVTSAEAAPAVADRVVSVSDADEEVREVVRSIVGLLDDGVPADRIAVFYPTADPYLRSLQHHLHAAEITANGPRADRLAQCAAARTLVAALALPDDGWRRDRVTALVAGAPLRSGAEPARPTAWERVSREAGVVGGLDDWHRKLAGYAELSDRAAEGAETEATRRWHQTNGAAARQLLDFVNRLAELVGAITRATSWRDKVGASRALLDALLGSERHRLRWPDGERDDLDRVLDALTRLAGLDDIEPRPSTATFRTALDAELDVGRGRTNPFGAGVLYAPLATAVGHDLDAVFVVGLVEGLCPAGRREEALLPERVRAATGQLVTPDQAMAAQHRALLAALAAAPAGRRTLTFPRGDLRSSRTTLPSRWMLASVSARAGRPVYSTEFPQLGAPDVDVVASFAAGLQRGAASAGEHDLAELSRFVDAGGDVLRHPALRGAERAIAAQRARRSARFTEWDGNLAGHAVGSPADGVTVASATRLERWARCGFRYFLDDVLGLEELDDPERIVSVSPLDRGSLLHLVLERFIGEALLHPPAPNEAWTARQRGRLHEIAESEFDALEAAGRTGRPLLWRFERRDLHRLLDRVLDRDDAERAARGATPVQVELPFGLDERPPLELSLADGRTMRFRGKADRVDRLDGGAHVVYDYKSGRGRDYTNVERDDPVKEGRLLQLGVYSEATLREFGGDQVSAHYWMIEHGQLAGYAWDDVRRRRFFDVLETIVDGIEQGVFPQVPGEVDTWRGSYENCRYCAFDDLCPVDRGDTTDIQADDPALEVRRRLAASAPVVEAEG